MVNIVRLCPDRVRYSVFVFLFFKLKMKEVISKQCLRMRLWGSVLIGREGTRIHFRNMFT